MVAAPRNVTLAPHFLSGMTRRVRRFSRLAFMIAVLVVFPFTRSSAAEFPGSPEYQLKAAFLYNFIKFTEWPDHQSKTNREHFIIGVLGKDPFGPVLDHVVQGETVDNKPIVVKRFIKMEQAAVDSHVLFISVSEENNIPAILSLLDGQSVLTVSESKDFAPRGGMIQLRTENNKIVFDINFEAVKRARLTMNAQLLKLAKTVKSKP
jgi:hypothetical protein